MGRITVGYLTELEEALRADTDMIRGGRRCA